MLSTKMPPANCKQVIKNTADVVKNNKIGCTTGCVIAGGIATTGLLFAASQGYIPEPVLAMTKESLIEGASCLFTSCLGGIVGAKTAENGNATSQKPSSLLLSIGGSEQDTIDDNTQKNLHLSVFKASSDSFLANEP